MISGCWWTITSTGLYKNVAHKHNMCVCACVCVFACVCVCTCICITHAWLAAVVKCCPMALIVSYSGMCVRGHFVLGRAYCTILCVCVLWEITQSALSMDVLRVLEHHTLTHTYTHIHTYRCLRICQYLVQHIDSVCVCVRVHVCRRSIMTECSVWFVLM